MLGWKIRSGATRSLHSSELYTITLPKEQSCLNMCGRQLWTAKLQYMRVLIKLRLNWYIRASVHNYVTFKIFNNNNNNNNNVLIYIARISICKFSNAHYSKDSILQQK